MARTETYQEGGSQAMVLYTIYPQEVVFQVDEPRNYLTVEVDNRVFVIELVNGQAQIVRLISTILMTISTLTGNLEQN